MNTPTIYNTSGKQYTADIWLHKDNPLFTRGSYAAMDLSNQIINALDLHVVDTAYQLFQGGGGGETIVHILQESHLALHTYPEHDFIAIDLFTCGDFDSSKLIIWLKENQDRLRIETIQFEHLKRGERQRPKPDPEIEEFAPFPFK